MFGFLFRRAKAVSTGPGPAAAVQPAFERSAEAPVVVAPSGGAGLHIPPHKLTRQNAHLHYAISSLREELEAVDWYRQRADDTDDAELKAILLHNADEEIEHAAMLLEWLRRREPRFAKELKEYLFTDGPIVEVEKKAMGRE